jgi:hypothetical protein
LGVLVEVAIEVKLIWPAKLACTSCSMNQATPVGLQPSAGRQPPRELDNGIAA